MYTKITLRFLTLFLGSLPLAMAENSGYLVSDTPIKVDYIICSESKPQECHKGKAPAEPAVTLNATQKIYAVKNIPERGLAMIIGLTTDNKHSYMYSDSTPCILLNDTVIKFELYDNIIICHSQPVAVAQ